MIKACIFDMDGTLVNTINSISHFANNALNKAGLDPIDVEDYKYMVGNGAKVLVERMIEKLGADKKYFNEVFPYYNTTYDNDFLYLTEPYDGITDTLKSLKNNGIKSAILSNKPHQTAKKVSDALFGEELIDICAGAKDGVKLKPSPDGVFEIIKKLNVTASECIYIGDTSTDMLTGKNAGLYTVGVLWGFRKRDELEESGADVVISHPAELIGIINRLNAHKED